MKELLLSVQQGMHSGVDTYIDINLQKYDSLLTDVLKAHNIDVPHHTLYIYTGTAMDSSKIYIDTLLALVKTYQNAQNSDAAETCAQNNI